MKKINYNKTTGSLVSNDNNRTKNVNIAHFDAKGLLYLWLFSFLFNLLIIILGFAFLQYQIGQLS
jgi:hypothetical protein